MKYFNRQMDKVKSLAENAKNNVGKVVIAGSIAGATAANATLATDLTTITTAATDGVALVSASQSTVIVSIFGLILLGVGAGWIFRSIRTR